MIASLYPRQSRKTTPTKALLITSKLMPTGKNIFSFTTVSYTMTLSIPRGTEFGTIRKN